MLGEVPRDYDFFTTIPLTKGLATRDVSRLHVPGMLLKTNNSYTVLDPNSDTVPKLQVIIRRTGLPAEIVSEFDFVHCQNYFDDKLHLSEAACRSILTKELKIANFDNPVSTLLRVNKFASRGWTISDEDYYELICHISSLDLTAPRELRKYLPKCATHDNHRIAKRVASLYAEERSNITLEELDNLDLDTGTSTSLNYLS